MASEVPATIDTSVTAVGPLADMFAGMNIGNDDTAEATSATTGATTGDATAEQQSQSSKRRVDEEGRPTPSESVAGRQ